MINIISIITATVFLSVILLSWIILCGIIAIFTSIVNIICITPISSLLRLIDRWNKERYKKKLKNKAINLIDDIRESSKVERKTYEELQKVVSLNSRLNEIETIFNTL